MRLIRSVAHSPSYQVFLSLSDALLRDALSIETHQPQSSSVAVSSKSHLGTLPESTLLPVANGIDGAVMAAFVCDLA